MTSNELKHEAKFALFNPKSYRNQLLSV